MFRDLGIASTYPRLVADDGSLDDLPKVTPYLLRRAASMCPRRLAQEFEGRSGSGDPVNRARLREAFLNAVRTAHAALGPLDPAAFRTPAPLEPEEQAVFEHAVGWYEQLFGARAVETYLHGCDSPTKSPRRGVRIGGWIDLTVVGADGMKELRQLELWGGQAPDDDPLEVESVLLAVLRLVRWAGDEPLLVSWSDLVRGLRYERIVHLKSELPELVNRFESELHGLTRRVADPAAAAGRDCGDCKHVWHCPEHPDGINVGARRNDLRPGIITLTPTSLEAWTRCGRAWRNQYLLSVPASDDAGPSHHGQQLHDLLRFVHEQGSCRDPDHVAGVLDGHGADPTLREEIQRHATRCPEAAESVGHELEAARFHRHPWPPFMATARFDAVWVHDGLLDVRDYKTGRRWYERITEDPRAKVQAWVAARLARERGLQLRLRYEHLAAEIVDDPDPWEPEADDLVALEEELRQAVEAIQAESGWQGVNDEAICRGCRYRSICPDSAVRSQPLWPVVEDEAADETDEVVAAQQ